MADTSRGPWSVKGIDERAREAAREAARRRGVTLGDYLNELLTGDSHEIRRVRPSPPRDYYDDERDFEAFRPSPPERPKTGLTAVEALRALTRRIEAVEAKSTLAITGIDQSVIGLVRRLENSEAGQEEIGAHVERVLDDVRTTHEKLQDRIRRIEADDSATRNLESLKALEEALGKLAAHVYEEGELAQAETDAIKGRMEAGFGDLTERVEGMEVRVETSLSEAARRVEKAVEQAELRTEGASRHLSERFTALEEKVTARMAKVDQVVERVGVVESDVSGALDSMEGLMTRIQERLNRAEATTDGAMKALETTFDALDKRITEVASNSAPEQAEALRKQFEDRFEGLANALQANVEKARAELAAQIERTARMVNPEQVVKLGARLTEVSEKLDRTEDRHARAINAVGQEIQRVTETYDARLNAVEALDVERVREAAKGEIERLSGEVRERLDDVDRREASAIAEVGE